MSATDPIFDPHFPTGAELEPMPDGTSSAARANPTDEEFATLESGALLVDRPWRSLLMLGGEDRVRFLNGLMTCDVKQLEVGQGSYGFFTDGKGRILGDAVVLATESALLIDVPRSRAEALIEHLTKYIITDRVEPSLLPVRSFLLAGPNARSDWSAAGGSDLPAEPWAHREAALEGVPVGLVDERRVGVPAMALWVDSERAVELFETLAERVNPGGWRAIDAARTRAGVPWFGVDFDAENIPQETSITSAVSFEKGCYLGQEVVARVHFLGKASRTLQRVRFVTGEPLEAPVPLTADDRELGMVTSLTRSGKEWTGVAAIHRRVMEEGLSLVVSGDAEVEVDDVAAV